MNNRADYLTELMSVAAVNVDSAKLSIGEAAAMFQAEFGRGALRQAAREINRPYSTLAEYARVVKYYQADVPLSLGESEARVLLDTHPVLNWTHLRVAKGLSKDPQVALNALNHALDHDMSLEQFKRYVAKTKGKPRYYRFDVVGPHGVMVFTIRPPNES